MFDLNGKAALITGASGGIGGAVARALHKQGAKIAVSGTNQGKLTSLAAELGERVFIVPADLSDLVALKRLVETAEEKMHGLDILVNNAGLTRDSLALRMKEDDWDQVLTVNLKAAFKLSQAAMRGMMKRRGGRIICISSVVGVTGNAGQANYAASKAGMIGMCKSLAREVANRGITVNCVAPGFIQTQMTAALPDSAQEGLLTTIPVGRMGESAEIAAAVTYLASDEAAYVTGETLHVNGGMAMI